ncbi:acyltransferase family protein [Rhizosphaericola mali]|uniref:DUF5009 domain-containing protein n=1 Tax=Rhizosphaericola mali TaxID=2545455 RepID=A0A5P2G3V3_9BACT|nr:DUF5009 domain-containing protein [Rhizosphaericola mali]QES90496.1 DUF5009 domain-containing protein [Rhizosphaericola mali]
MSQPKDRFLSLDVFRGLIVGFMIIVNMPGNPETTVPALTFANWNSFTPADLIYPAYIFCVGIGLFFSLKEWQEMHSKGRVFLIILRRSILMFLIGLLINWFPFFQIDLESGEKIFTPFSQVRIWGFLQRLGVLYFITSCLLLFTNLRVTLALGVLFLVGYWPVLYFGGKFPNPYSIRHNLVLHIDKLMIGTDHLDQSPIVPFEEFGFLSTFPAFANIIAGFLTARIIFKKKITYETLTLILISGFMLMSLAYIWNNVLPVNRKLWTSSFAVESIGLCLSILAIIIYVVDKIHYTKEANFFRVFGRNPLVAYILSMTMTIPLQLIEVEPGLSISNWLYINVFSYASAYIGSFLQAALFMFIIWLICRLLDRKGDYLTL